MSASTVVFFGYGPLAVAGIDALRSAGASPSLVVLPGNRNGTAVDAVAAHAKALGIPVGLQPRRSAIEPFATHLRTLAPDVFVVWSYSMLLPQSVLDIPRLGTVNVHSGVLPEYRGGHVLQWALINGERETGVTLQFMDAGVDTGPVIAEQRFPIDADADAVSVKDKLKEAGVALLREWWPRIASGTAPRTPQDESRARYWPMRKPEDGRIDVTRPAVEICRLIRALNANDPGAYIDVGARRVSILRATNNLGHGVTGARLATGDGEIAVTDARIDGRSVDPSELQRLFSSIRNRVSHTQPIR